MNAYAKERKAFGQPLHAFGQVQKHIAESYAEYMAGALGGLYGCKRVMIAGSRSSTAAIIITIARACLVIIHTYTHTYNTHQPP